MKFEDYLNEQLKDPEFKKEWNAIQSEMESIQAEIDARIEKEKREKLHN